MLRRRPAASAYQAHSRSHELARITRHILRRTQIDVAALDRSRHTGIGLGRQRQGSERTDTFNHIQHRHRAHAAIAADDVGAPAFNSWCKALRSRAVEAVPVFINGDVGHHRDFGIHVPGRQNRLVKLLDVAEGFQHQQVNAAFDQGRDLLAEGSASFLE